VTTSVRKTKTAIHLCLTAVFAQSPPDFWCHAFFENVIPTHVAFAFCTDPNVSVGATARLVFDFAGCRQTETLLDPFMGLHFGRHFLPILTILNCTSDEIPAGQNRGF
jgi:hypothetical protein